MTFYANASQSSLSSYWSSSGSCGGPPSLVVTQSAATNFSLTGWYQITGGSFLGFCGQEYILDCSAPSICLSGSQSVQNQAFLSSTTVFAETISASNNSFASNGFSYCQISNSPTGEGTVFNLLASNAECHLDSYICKGSILEWFPTAGCKGNKSTIQLGPSFSQSTISGENVWVSSSLASGGINSVLWTTYQIYGAFVLNPAEIHGGLCLCFILLAYLVLARGVVKYSIALYKNRKRRNLYFLACLLAIFVEVTFFAITYFKAFDGSVSPNSISWIVEIWCLAYGIESTMSVCMNAYNIITIVLHDRNHQIIFIVALFLIWFFFGSLYWIEGLFWNPNFNMQPVPIALNYYLAVDVYPYWQIFAFLFDPLSSFLINVCIARSTFTRLNAKMTLKKVVETILKDSKLRIIMYISICNFLIMSVLQILIQYTLALGNDYTQLITNSVFLLQHAVNALISMEMVEHFPNILLRMQRISSNSKYSRNVSGSMGSSILKVRRSSMRPVSLNDQNREELAGSNNDRSNNGDRKKHAVSLLPVPPFSTKQIPSAEDVVGTSDKKSSSNLQITTKGQTQHDEFPLKVRFPDLPPSSPVIAVSPPSDEVLPVVVSPLSILPESDHK